MYSAYTIQTRVISMAFVECILTSSIFNLVVRFKTTLRLILIHHCTCCSVMLWGVLCAVTHLWVACPRNTILALSRFRLSLYHCNLWWWLMAYEFGITVDWEEGYKSKVCTPQGGCFEEEFVFEKLCVVYSNNYFTINNSNNFID